MCNVPKKSFLKSRSISNEILIKLSIRATWLSKGNIKWFQEQNEWLDKCDKTGFGSVARVGRGGIFSHGHPP